MTQTPGPRPIVYLGPSLPLDEAKRLLDGDYRPPVKRGDLPHSFDGTIVMIDGEFGQSLSVSPNEVLRLLDQGTRMIGAASMGALRAAELYPYGMQGCGWIFDAYMSGRLIADDEVAVTYSPLDLAALTVPLVNVRAWLERLESTGQIDGPTGRMLLARARRIFYADRTEEYLIAEWELAIGKDKLGRILLASGGQITDIKAEDARHALAAAHELTSTIARKEMRNGVRYTSQGPGQSPGQGQQHQPSDGLIELLGRAVTDEQFRDKLYTDQEDATKGYMLTDGDRMALANLPRDELEQQAQRFGASSATAISIGISIKGSF